MTIDRLKTIIGLPALLTLVDLYGGIRLYVPLRMDADHVLARAIGLRAARALAAHCGGERFQVPRGLCLERAKRDREIRAATDTAPALARKYGLTERQVRHIRREA